MNLSDPQFWQQPREERAAAFAALRAEDPVSWHPPPVAWAPRNGVQPQGYYAVTRHADVSMIHRNPDVFRSGRGVMLYDNLPPDLQYLYDGWISADAPRHTSLRRHIARAFSPRVIRGLEDQIQQCAGRCVRQAAELGECDFYHDIVAGLPIAVTQGLLGVPEADRSRLARLVHKAVRFGSASSFTDCLDSARQVREYAQDLANERRANPTGDLMTTIVRPGPDGTQLTDRDAVVTFWMVLTAGSDTMALAATHGMAALAAHPDQREHWQANFGRLADTAIEEILRWSTPVISMRRTTVVDTEVAGHPVAEGENVLLIYSSANRDERAFCQPNRFDLGRTPNHHVAFGSGGPHFCLGAHLARLELKAFFGELFRRLPDIDVCGQLVHVPDPFIDDVSELPCHFTVKS